MNYLAKAKKKTNKRFVGSDTEDDDYSSISSSGSSSRSRTSISSMSSIECDDFISHSGSINVSIDSEYVYFPVDASDGNVSADNWGYVNCIFIDTDLPKGVDSKFKIFNIVRDEDNQYYFGYARLCDKPKVDPTCIEYTAIEELLSAKWVNWVTKRV